MTVYVPLGMANTASFRMEAMAQRVCAACGKAGPWHPHHVVYEQILKNRYGLRGHELWDSANALRLCLRCHQGHHGTRKIPTRKLKDLNIEYAFYVMGDFAIDWLRRYYDDSDPDPRILRLES